MYFSRYKEKCERIMNKEGYDDMFRLTFKVRWYVYVL
jgi:hypothetical protein